MKNIKDTDLIISYVNIPYEEDLHEVKNILIQNNQVIDEERFKFIYKSNFENQLIYGTYGWFIGNSYSLNEISISELKTKLEALSKP